MTGAGAVHRVEFAVDWPPGHVAASGDEPLLVDAGTPGVDAGLAECGYGPGDVAHLVVTRPHVDHVGQVETLPDAGDPTVYAPAGGRGRFRRDEAALRAAVRENVVAAGVDSGRVDQSVEWTVGAMTMERDLLPPAAVGRWVAAGETVTAGGCRFEAVHAPGHQADHCCFAGRAAASVDDGVRRYRPDGASGRPPRRRWQTAGGDRRFEPGAHEGPEDDDSDGLRVEQTGGYR